MLARTRREVDHVMRTIFKRCVECNSDEIKGLSCDGVTCPKNQICVMTPTSCDKCAYVGCRADPTANDNDSGPSTNVGAIAGGVIGGIAVIAIIVFIVWKYCLKGKRRPISEANWQEVDMMEQQEQEKFQSDFESRRSARASTHTVASMASSVLTRASNIIQIAYIPGVTNRSGPGSPDLLVPPVPPIPAMSPSSGLSSPYAASEQHFFVPDFRDSMASTSTDARTSIAPSLARNSVASTVYRQNAIVSPLPAQTVVRGKAAVVSVKSTGSNSPSIGGETPPVPQIDPKHQKGHLRIHMPGISPANSVKTIAQLGGVKALNITKKKSMESTPPKSSAGSSTADSEQTLISPDPLVPLPRPLTEVSLASTDDGMSHHRARQAISIVTTDSDSDDDDHARARKSLLRHSDIAEADTPTSMNSPFSDSPLMGDQLQVRERDSSRPPMTPIFEESKSSKRSSASSKRGQSPFADHHKSDL